MDNKLCPVSFGSAAAILSALCVLAAAFSHYFGFDKEAAEAIAKHHYAFFSLTPVGVLIGAVAAGLKGFVFGYLFAWLYNHCPLHGSK